MTKWGTSRGWSSKHLRGDEGYSYQQADAETIKNVVLHPTHRIVSR